MSCYRPQPTGCVPDRKWLSYRVAAANHFSGQITFRHLQFSTIWKKQKRGHDRIRHSEHESVNRIKIGPKLVELFTFEISQMTTSLTGFFIKRRTPTSPLAPPPSRFPSDPEII